MSTNENLIENTRFRKAAAEGVVPAVESKEPTDVFKSDYQEVPGRSGRETDVLSQLQSNVIHLQNLQTKMRFLLKEINGLVKSV